MPLKQQKKFLIEQLSRFINNKKVIDAFKKIKREEFVIKKYRDLAYIDEPLPILEKQTISQPSTVALMTNALEVKQSQKILEIGTGSGYQAAILSYLVGKNGQVITIERVKKLYNYAKKKLKHFKNIKIILGDGSKGYQKEAPYDRIIVTAAAPYLSEKLFSQLKEKGIMLVPVQKGFYQKMFKIKKINNAKIEEDLGFFVFVPLIGEFGYKKVKNKKINKKD